MPKPRCRSRSPRSPQDFAALDDAYLAARVEDIREVGDRLIRNLTKTPLPGLLEAAGRRDHRRRGADARRHRADGPGPFAGFATVLGGAESHTAIMARSLGLPAVLGVPELRAARCRPATS